jgi:UDP-3-O-[3-hydroxymyristoyl] glucosamine N-acyltransferase
LATSYRLDELAQRVGGTVRGKPERLVRGIATLAEAGEDDLSFLTNPRYRASAERSRAGAILVKAGAPGPGGHDLLEVPEPYLALAHLLELFHPVSRPRPGVSPDARLGEDAKLGRDVHVGAFAVVGDGCELGDRVVVGPGCVLGESCRVGSETELRPRVVLYPGTRVGCRCLLHAGVVLGGDGFGFATSGGVHHKVPQVGRVVVGDDVEIGANSAVDRAMLGETRVGTGSKIDDLVMIAHGVQVGPRALFAAQAGIAGSAKLGANATLAGQAGVAGHLELGDRVTVAAKSAVFADLSDDSAVAGIPAIDLTRWKRSQALLRTLPELRRELRTLKERLEAVERRLARED